VVVAFFVCWAPFHAQRLMASLLKTPTDAQVLLFHLLTNISGVTYYFSATINPILYSIMSAKFRRAFWDTLRCWCWTGRPIVNGSMMQRKHFGQSSRMMSNVGHPHSASTMTAVTKLRNGQVPISSIDSTSTVFNAPSPFAHHSHPIRTPQSCNSIGNGTGSSSHVRPWRFSQSSDSRPSSTRASSVFSLNQTFDLNNNANHSHPIIVNGTIGTSGLSHPLQQMPTSLQQLPLGPSGSGDQPRSSSLLSLVDSSDEDKSTSGLNGKRGRFIKRQSTISLVGSSSPIIEEDEGSSRV
jgi:hypothetical protein